MKYAFASAALLVALIAAPAAAQSVLSIDTVSASIQSSGLPISNLVVYTAATDPDNLLGQPNEYIERMSWHDTRVPGTDTESSLEVFANLNDLQTRAAYLNALSDSNASLEQYIVEDDTHMALLRLPMALTPDQAVAYQNWLTGL